MEHLPYRGIIQYCLSDTANLLGDNLTVSIANIMHFSNMTWPCTAFSDLEIGVEMRG
jgi:hypothetical protein